MPIFALTIFLSAFLLFQVQPMIAKYILPWFGGSPAVWTTCMLFFQVLMPAGYAYAHWTSNKLSNRNQALLHGILLASSLIFLPIAPTDAWKPQGDELPTWRILALLTVTLAGPYFMLSTTGPLLQRWFSRLNPNKSPYPLFALSNAGSLLALISYPLIMEPKFDVDFQVIIWSIGFVAFVGVCIVCGYLVYQGKVNAGGSDGPKIQDNEYVEEDSQDPPAIRQIFLWLGLAAFPSVMLLAVTNQLCREVAVVPFLWVLPLGLYLLTFILCFEGSFWYKRAIFGPLMFLSSAGACVLLFYGVKAPLWTQITGYSLTLFSVCMCCHGELAKSKPPTKYLTNFYLMMSIGGALGGIFVVIIAPAVFPQYQEFHVGLPACLLFTLIAWYHSPNCKWAKGEPLWAWMGMALLAAFLVGALIVEIVKTQDNVIAWDRNFYGVLKITEGEDSKGKYRSLSHGRIQHGVQYTEYGKDEWPTTYYNTHTGAGVAIMEHPYRKPPFNKMYPLKIGLIGLGTGTLAIYGRKNEQIRIYEINPAVRKTATEYFTFCSKSKGYVEFIMGDARIKLEQEATAGEIQNFDVLVVDAFSSDAIPMHLLTRECWQVYWKHLSSNGILAVHISNRYLDLKPVVYNLAIEFNQTPLLMVYNAPDDEPRFNSCTWILVTQNRAFLENKRVKGKCSAWPDSAKRKLIWTDRYGSLLQVVK